MVVSRERKNGSWRTLSDSEVEDVSSEVSARGRLEGILWWARNNLLAGDYLVIQIEDKAILRVRAWKEFVAMSGFVRKSFVQMFLSSEDITSSIPVRAKAHVVSGGRRRKADASGIPNSMDGYFKWGVDALSDADQAAFSIPGLMAFRARRKDRRIGFCFVMRT